ncbi:hypothetical protein M9H77_36911 [Catharanthus roseus]|uniref:Uncharacterized protein n=1 Tax=Catharanthus roseus TaxID=4058 RepID=A0ACB9ZVQ8_CATRO|nr:hypothetical protein M9H77_36911 [Catharanthus roseus]
MDSGTRKYSIRVADLDKTEKEKPFSISSKIMELLKEFRTKGKLFKGENLYNSPNSSTSSSHQVFSADRIMKLAKAKLHLLKSEKKADFISILATDHFGPHQSSLPSEVSEDLELALLIQASAEFLASGNFSGARRLLCLCDDESFKDGSPVQRVTYYFAKALKERIEFEQQFKSPSTIDGENRKPAQDVVQILSLKPAYIAAQQECPFSLAAGCTAVQSILDNVITQKKIHLIDFGINNGSHWTILMQALALQSETPLELLKITAVGTLEEMMKEIGKRLSSFAKSLNITFSFKIIVSDLKDLEEDSLDLESDESVVIYMALRGQLEGLMGLIKNLKPCLILVREVEICTKFPGVLEQFNEALLFFSALFDCVKICLENQFYRKLNEEHFLGENIRNIITANGSDRIYYDRIDGWRELFSRFNIVEAEFSPLSLCQASLLLKRSLQWSSCSLDMDGKCLILSWNETRMFSLSAWKPL